MNCVRTGMNSQFRPRVPTSGRDCGVATTEELIRFGSRGQIKLTPLQVRKRMKNLKNWTNPIDVKKAVDSIDRENKRRGMQPLKFKLAGKWIAGNTLIASGASKQSLINRAKRGELMQLVIDYAKVNRKYPWLSGSKTFMGLHSVWAGGHRNKKGDPGIRTMNGKLEMLYADPTWNRQGTPKGPKWVAVNVIWDISNGAWSSKGGTGWVGGSVKCADLLKATDPVEPPDPADPIEECDTTDLEEELAASQAALVEARDTIAELEQSDLDQEVIDNLSRLVAEMDAELTLVRGVGDKDIAAGVKAPEA